MTWVGEATQIDKIDFSSELVGHRVASRDSDRCLANTAGSKQRDESTLSNPVLDFPEYRAASDHGQGSWEPPDGSAPIALAYRAIFERNDRADE